MQSTYYDVLEVTSSATAEEIKAAFRRQAKKYHPDLNGGREQEVKPLFLRAQKAYDILSDPARRAKYDARLSSQNDWGRPEPAPVYEIKPIDEFQIAASSLETAVVLPRRRRLSPEARKVIIFVAACIALAVLIVCVL